VSDWLDDGGAVERLQELVEATPEWEPTEEPEPPDVAEGVFLRLGLVSPTTARQLVRLPAGTGIGSDDILQSLCSH